MSQDIQYLLDDMAKLNSGDRAELRRWRPDRKVRAAAFWRFYIKHHTPEEDGPLRTKDVQIWAVLFAALAQTGHLQNGPSLGRALGECDFSEARLIRLLDAPEGPSRQDAVLKTAGFLVAKHQKFRAHDLAWLILFTDPEKLEKLRLQIARDFYGQQAKNKKGA